MCYGWFDTFMSRNNVTCVSLSILHAVLTRCRNSPYLILLLLNVLQIQLIKQHFILQNSKLSYIIFPLLWAEDAPCVSNRMYGTISDGEPQCRSLKGKGLETTAWPVLTCMWLEWVSGWGYGERTQSTDWCSACCVCIHTCIHLDMHSYMIELDQTQCIWNTSLTSSPTLQCIHLDKLRSELYR